MTDFFKRNLLRAALAAASAFGGASAMAQVQSPPIPTRGELLYTTHCIACHTTQMHWRDGRQATEWESIKVQVRRWHGISGLAWSDADITEVSRYLNDTIYDYPKTMGSLSMNGIR
jgi:mono/diheme cytochrome c family protein